VDDATFKVRSLTTAQADTVRADFLAYDDRAADARALLDHLLQEDPKNVAAHETMGYLEFRAGHLDEARKWYEQAVKLDSQSYVAHYYFAAISINAGASSGDDSQVESSLRAAIKLNPSFAPAFDSLAAFEGMRRRNLDEAHLMALTAVQLDPGNAGYRVTAANVLLQMNRGNDAAAVLRDALKVAKSPEETAMVENVLAQAVSYADALKREAEYVAANAQADAAFAQEEKVNTEAAEEELPKGPHHFLAGTLQDVHCHGSGIELTLAAKGKTTALHSGNYYKIEFSVLGFTPKGEINPCKDLEGKPAKVEYIESGKTAAPYVVAIEIHK
jgi:predicted Zn-dependent protease